MTGIEPIIHIIYRINPPVANEALNELFRLSWPAHTETNFQAELQHSLLYVCAYHNERLVGFVNVAWNGGVHAFLLDTTVNSAFQRRGIGLHLVQEAIIAAKARGILWLHVDYEPHLSHFYRQCGFQDTAAGLIRLTNDAYRGRLAARIGSK